jgi:hypothetical protein
MKDKDIQIIKINARDSFVETIIKYKGITYGGLLLKLHLENDKEIQTESS